MALGFGVVTLVLGLALDALQYFWRGQRHWLLCDAGLLVAYVGLVGAAIDLSALWLLPLGIAWSLSGAAVTLRRNGSRQSGRSAGEFVERLLQLGVQHGFLRARRRVCAGARGCARPSSAWLEEPRARGTGRY